MFEVKRGRLVASLVLGLVLALCLGAPSVARATDYPDVQLGIFWNSDEDLSDTLYMSFNGSDFYQIGTPYPADGNYSDHVTGMPTYVHSLHDPSIFTKDGYVWLASGYVQYQDGLGWRFTPMFGCSNDLVNWSYPNSGSSTNVGVEGSILGSYNDGQYDTAGAEAFCDTDGTVYMVTTLGYFAMNHGDSSSNDVMMPYILTATGLTPGADPASNPGAQPKVTYSDLTAINLPVSGTNWLDPSLYKEGDTYYLSIKKDGVTNQIYSIKDLSQAGDANAWTLVCSDVVTGYEGPSLSKLNGEYYMYTDKLKDYPYGASDGTAGVFVTQSTSLESGWCNTRRITTTSADGTAISNRHGSVITITDSAMKEKIFKAREDMGYGTFVDVFRTTPHKDDIQWLADEGISEGWLLADGTREFRGMESVKRQDMAAFLYRLAGSPAFDADAAAASNPFSDVVCSDGEGGTPHWREILWLYQSGVSTGWEEADGTRTFRGMDSVKRQDMAAFLCRLAGVDDEGYEPKDASAFSDVDETTPHWRAIMWLYDSGVSEGWAESDGTRTFRGMSEVVRQDMAAFLHRMYAKGLVADKYTS